VDFGKGVSSVTFQFAVTDRFDDKAITLRLDSPTGPAIGTLITTTTGSWAVYSAQSTSIKDASGVHKLFLTFGGKGAVGNIKSIEFN